MTSLTWRALPAWPYPPQPSRPAWFGKVEWGDAVQGLVDEVAAIEGDDLIIGVVIDPTLLTWDGRMRPKAHLRATHAGAEVSFDVKGTRLSFHTSAFADLKGNVHAIARGLEALRRIERYGITSGNQQYAGFALLPADVAVERGRRLVDEAGSIDAALKRHHPDAGGTADAFSAVIAYRHHLNEAGGGA